MKGACLNYRTYDLSLQGRQTTCNRYTLFVHFTGRLIVLFQQLFMF